MNIEFTFEYRHNFPNPMDRCSCVNAHWLIVGSTIVSHRLFRLRMNRSPANRLHSHSGPAIWFAMNGMDSSFFVFWKYYNAKRSIVNISKWKSKMALEKLCFLLINLRLIFFVAKLKRNAFSTCSNDRSMTINDIRWIFVMESETVFKMLTKYIILKRCCTSVVLVKCWHLNIAKQVKELQVYMTIYNSHKQHFTTAKHICAHVHA